MHLKTNSIKHMQSLIIVECGSQLIPVFSDIFKFFCSTYLEVLGHTKGCLQYEVPIHYQSDRINKQISSLPDILIKLKTEINSVLETPLAVE